MSLDIAKQIISKGLFGVSNPFKSVSYVQSEDESVISDSSTEVKDYGDKTLMSPVPKKVVKKDNVTTYTLPDGSEFSLDDRGRPVVSERTLTTEEKKQLRTGGGSFEETQEEIDHKISKAFGGTESTSNLEALKSTKTISQTVFDAITGKSRLPGEYKPENRQEGKMIVEWKAIEKYEAGDITLFEAMAAVQHYDNQELVASFLHEDPPKQSLIKKIGEFLDPKAGGPVIKAADKAFDFIKEKVKESRKTGILNDLIGSIGGKHYYDTEDGRALIAEVGSNLDEQEKIKAEEVVRSTKGVIESPFLALPPKTQAGLVVTAPIRWTAGSMARLLIDVGLEASGSDARFTPETNLQALLMGKEDFVRLSESGDLYGMAQSFVQKKLEAKGISSDKAHTAGLASALLIGSVLENPFFSFGKKPAKEALEVALRKSLERELGGELSEKTLKDLAFEAERIVGLPNETARATALQEFVEKTKVDPEVLGKVKAESIAEDIGLRAEPKIKAPLDQSSQSGEQVYKIIKQEGVVEVKGTPIKIIDGVDTFIHEGDRGWVVSESSTGRFLAESRSKEGAIAKAKFEIDNVGENKFKQLLLDHKLPTTSGDLIGRTSQLQSEIEPTLAKKDRKVKLKVDHEATTKSAQEISSYEEVLAKIQTPVNKKINLVDTYGRTPDRVMEKIGFGDEAKLLRKSHDAYVKELPKNIEKITAWSKIVPSKESNVKIFNFLDGKEVTLNETEAKIASEIKTWLSQWADRLGLPEDKRIASYITHLFDEELLAKEFDEDLAKIIANKLPGEVYDPFLQKRLGAKGFKQDTWAALDAYVKRATRKVHMDPALEAIKKKAGGSLETSKIEQSQFEYLQDYIANINLRPTKTDNKVDNAIKTVFGYKFGSRPVTRLAKKLRQWTFRGMLGLNPGSALRNISQGINTYAVLGEKYTTIGYAKLFNRGAMDELREVGVLADGFIQDRVLSSSKKMIEKADKVLFSFFDTAEKINRGAAYFGAKSKALSEGKTAEQAVDYAKGIVRKTQFVFDSVDTPVALQGDIVKTLTQFQTYTVKQVEFLTEMAMDKNVVGLLRYAVAGVVFATTVGQAFGMEFKDLIPGFRLGTPPSLKLPVEVVKATLDAPDKFGQDRDLQTKLSDVGKSAVGLFPAGSQIKKTVEGIKAIQEGGSYTKGGNLQFEQGQSLPEKAQAVLFGKNASDEAKAYFNKTAPSESEVEYLRITSLPQEERAAAYKALREENPSIAAQVKKLGEDKKSGITEEEKELRSLGVQSGQRAEAIVEALNALGTSEEKKALWLDYKAKKIITKSVAEQIKELLK